MHSPRFLTSMMPDSRAGMVLVLASALAVGGAFGYAQLLEDDERHITGGRIVAPTQTEQGGDATTNWSTKALDVPVFQETTVAVEPTRPAGIFSYSVAASPGTHVRLDRQAFAIAGNATPLLLDLYMVPYGEGAALLNRSPTLVLARQQSAQPTTSISNLFLSLDQADNGTNSISFSAVVPPTGEGPIFEGVVPEGAAGVDIVWLDGSGSAQSDPQVVFAVTKTDPRWIDMAPGFAAAEMLLVGVAGWAAYRWLKGSREPAAPADAVAAADLIAEAGTYVKRWRNTLALAGLLLAVTLWLGQASLETVLADEIPDARSVLAARFGYLAGSALLVIGWLAMVVRAHREAQRWTLARDHGPAL